MKLINYNRLALASLILIAITHHIMAAMGQQDPASLTEQDYRDFIGGYQANQRYNNFSIEEYIRDAKLLRTVGCQINDITSLNRANNNGWTVLIVAASNGRLGIVRALLAAGADVNRASNDGWTALMVAALHGHEDAVRALLEAGADVNLQGSLFGETALIVAASNGRLGIVRALLEAGADVNLKGRFFGETALILAALNNRVDIVWALLEAGADVDLQNNQGETAEHVATPQARAAIEAYRRLNQERAVTVIQAPILRNGDRPAMAGMINSFL